MVQAERHQDSIKAIKGIISGFYTYMADKGEPEFAEKARQLGWKFAAGEQVIAFCGHFSAGKSSMINKLAGEDLLPSSPIPTSANLVRIKSGEDYAKVYFKKDIPWLYLPPYDYSAVKSHCMDGDEIKQIEISSQKANLPSNIVILDTPGIDSADDAHRIATESAIHLADLVLYVMDYNHVQSEVNFLFTKELYDAGKEVFLVINQIDKHREEELHFSDYKESVHSSFQSWGVNLAGILYTSLKEPGHPHNQLKELENLVRKQLENGDKEKADTIKKALSKLGEEYLQKLEAGQEDERQRLENILEGCALVETEQLHAAIEIVKGKLAESDKLVDETSKEFDAGVEQILKNAYLMPFETREKAKLYLESTQPGFKVGLFFSEGKTNAEKKARMESFFKDVNEKTKQQAEWHLRELLLTAASDKGIREEGILDLARNFSIPLSQDVLEKPLKQGALISGDYLLTYTGDLANEIKKSARRRIQGFKREYVKAIRTLTEQNTLKEKEELDGLIKLLEAREALDQLDKEVYCARLQLEETIEGSNSFSGDFPQGLFEKEDKDIRIIRNNAEETGIARLVKEHREDKGGFQDHQGESEPGNNDIPGRLRKAADAVMGLPGFSHIAEDLRQRAERLENRSYTVALFGAFSAGKSSFANALIGEAVLPVSPNPTTAAICRIKPVTAEEQHGSVRAKMKDQETLLADVNRALKFFGEEVVELPDAFEKIARIESLPFQGDTAEKTNLSFLQAFKRGYEAAMGHLGQIVKAGYEDFGNFVALEEKSCYLEWIDLYYDCPLTKRGITLVDTPGADSINARHTSVAFDYIKNADAILFVTYYNHAFSRADREFLIQLGRVKEVFELDKMFFIVNAIDLAKDEEEKEVVLSYVKGQLEKYGIRKPNINAVSSLEGLKEKNGGIAGGQSGIPEFEKDFFRFFSDGLSKIAFSAAEKEIRRLTEMATHLLHSARQDKSIAEEKAKQLYGEKEKAMDFLAKQSFGHLERRVVQEAEELVHYCKQRVFLRFGDFFKESFNPSVINDSRNLKMALVRAMEDLLESLGHDLGQEMRATSLRMEKFAERTIKGYREGLETDLSEISNGLTLSAMSLPSPEGIDFPRAFEGIGPGQFSKHLGLFKNPKDFFEKNGKRTMQESLHAALGGEADAYLKKQAGIIEAYAIGLVQKWGNKAVEDAKAESEDYFSSMLEVLEGNLDIRLLERTISELAGIMKGKGQDNIK